MVMNAFPVCHIIFILLTVLIQTHQNGTRVFYWDVNGTIKYGAVESTSRMTDVSLCYISIYNNLLKCYMCHRAPKWSMLKLTAGLLSACRMLPLSWSLFFSYCSDLPTVFRVSPKLHRNGMERLIVVAWFCLTFRAVAIKFIVAFGHC